MQSGLYAQFVCTAEQFNAMVAEMSEGFEEYKREYELDKAATAYGMVYEIGKSYITDNGEIAILCSLESSGGFIVMYPDNTSPFVCRGLSTNPEWTTGTITPAPVELIDGKAYMFTNESGVCYGEYSDCGNKFYSGGYCYTAEGATNIIPLVPEVK